MNLAVEMMGVHKRFPRVVANSGASLTVAEGEIHALVGENGAGKSTLMKILYGMLAPDAGSVKVLGKEMKSFSPATSIAAGIGMVHQHFMLVPTLTVAENVVLGMEPRFGPWFDTGQAEHEVAEMSTRFGLAVEPRALVETLPVGVQQRVEILKVLARGAKILILDEPTAVLTPGEVEELYATLAKLKAEGRTVVLITHKLKEVKAVSDRLTVLRRGATAGTAVTADVTEEKIAEMMVGRAVVMKVDKKNAKPGEVVLSLKGLQAAGVGPATFDVRAGEIVGIAGVEGNGQSELLECLSGLRAAQFGSASLGGLDLSHSGPAAWFKAGLAVIPEDRQKRGLVGEFTVAENLVLGRHREAKFVKRGFVNTKARAAEAATLVKRNDVRPAEIDVEAQTLSGGNQQKAIVARELARQPRLLIAAHPTRGVDIGAIEFIHKAIVSERDRGAAVLLVSSELSEVLALADRVLVMFGGKIAGELKASEASEKRIGVMMTGAKV
jgi:general nucleoside transport system ATP-binding protein